MLTASILPTGIPMPFISAGGTSLSVFMDAIGILGNVGKSEEIGGEFKKKSLIKHFLKIIKKSIKYNMHTRLYAFFGFV